MRIGFGVTLLIGGARSGKSNMALQLGLSWNGPVCFVATATAGDDDMANRIERHQGERPESWSLIEQPTFGSSDVPDGEQELLILDCATMLVANLMFANADGHDHKHDESESASDDAIVRHVSELVDALRGRRGPSIIVTNEVGLGVHPETPLGRRYRDTLGRANRALAERSETSLFVVAGKVAPLVELSLDWAHHSEAAQQ